MLDCLLTNVDRKTKVDNAWQCLNWFQRFWHHTADNIVWSRCLKLLNRSLRQRQAPIYILERWTMQHLPFQLRYAQINVCCRLVLKTNLSSLSSFPSASTKAKHASFSFSDVFGSLAIAPGSDNNAKEVSIVRNTSEVGTIVLTKTVKPWIHNKKLKR